MIVNIYTDGACKGNPGNGGYGFTINVQDDNINYKKLFAFGVKETTNNRMELTAVIHALEELYNCKPFADKLHRIEHGLHEIFNTNTLKEIDINIYSDSQYVCKAINLNWLNNWAVNEFKKIKNPDLWQKLLSILSQINGESQICIDFKWVKGHDGNEDNEEVDMLANLGCGKEGVVLESIIEINNN